MRKIVKIMSLSVVIVVLAAGCGTSNNAGHTSNSNNVDNVLNQQVSNANNDAENSADSNKSITNNNSTSEEENTYTLLKDEDGENEAEPDSSVDYDLTTMGSDMVYATVYQLMVNPDEYVGKTFKMNGTYYASYYEPTAKYYNYCIIKDALACCSQGLEFVCEDGSNTYPDDYPADNTEIIVTGTFETYKEEGNTSLFCRLSHATMEIEK